MKILSVSLLLWQPGFADFFLRFTNLNKQNVSSDEKGLQRRVFEEIANTPLKSNSMYNKLATGKSYIIKAHRITSNISNGSF